MPEEIKEANAADWKEQVLEAKKLVVVQFWHPLCPHCQAIKPVYNELAAEYKDRLKFTKLNVVDSTENKELAGKYGVMGTPTFLFFCGGRPVNGVVGALPKEDLTQAIEFIITKHKDCTKKSTPLKLSYIS
ncbi:MAG: thiol reductase thioredoxin [Candidatus Bathyarchaeum sp.]|nr:MAG: thiol reductase thioredoxin [Candidatus Bathyarchaeum sp.]